MSRRRRGADFSDLLESFCSTTDCRTDLNTKMPDLDSIDNLDKENQYKDNNICSTKNTNNEIDENSVTCSYKSTIISGHAVETQSQGSTENSYQTARTGSTADKSPSSAKFSEDSFCRSEAPSLMNRAIDIQFIPQSDLDLSQSTVEPRTSDELNRNIETSEKSSHDSRDTNYNIKNNLEQPTATTSSTISHLRTNSPRPKRISTTPTSRDSEAKILKRLSQEFIYSPHLFTERLVTIIDENETGYDNCENSGVDLSRMTREFRKMCKFIQDESMPEHMNSTVGISRHLDEHKFANNPRPETIVESPIELSLNDDFQTPETRDNGRKIYRKTPLNIFKKNIRDNGEVQSPGSPNSTKNFVFLEKCLNEQPASPLSCKATNRSSSSSDISEQLRDKMILVQKSEQQLASLDETNCREFETFDSHPAHGAQEREPYDNRLDFPNVHNLPINEDNFNEDDLSTSLRLELEKKRERCFETARQMQKIEEDARASNENYPKVLERYGIDPVMECRKTIKSLLDYQNCWTMIRHNDNVKKNEVSSLDSGIDARSISRTLQASSKKSYNNEATSKSTLKNNCNYEISKKYPRSAMIGSLRSNVPRASPIVGKTRNETKIVKNTAKMVDNTRKRSPGNMCPTTRAIARSRSRSGEKPSKTRQVSTKFGNFRTTEIGRTNEKLEIPKIVVERNEIFDKQPANPQKSNDEKHNTMERARLTPIIFNTPNSRYQVSSSPRSTKITNTVRGESPSSMKSRKNRFFVTPGKTLPVKVEKKRLKTFFPSLDDDIQQEGSQRIMKSVHAPGIYRSGYNTVISPVSMYIRGTDMKLIQTLQGKTNEMLLTPKKATTSEEKLNFKLSRKTSTPRYSPRRNISFSDEKDSDSQSDTNDENKHEPNFALPKTHYEPSSRVHTLNQSPKNIGGARARGLLQSMQNRVVIRHQGKMSEKYDEQDVPESGSDSVDMSIHVQRSAEKTNYMNRLK